MSSDSDIAEIISEQYFLWVGLLVTHATLTLMCYDWFLNLDEEIKLFWSRKVTAATILYFPIRYLVIVYWILGYPVVSMPGASCEAYLYTIYVLQLLLFVCPAAFSALRVYALTGQNKILALITLFFSLGPIYANSVHYGWEKPEYFAAESVCLIIDNATSQMGIIFTVISRGLLSTGDLLVIVITVVKTIYVTRHRKGMVGSTSLARTLLYSGVVYYIPLAILNIVHMSMTATGADQFLRTTSVVSIFMDPITSVLACRFLMNLRKAEEGRRSTGRYEESTAAYWQTVQFTPGAARTLPSFIASMGELRVVDIDFAHPDASATGDSEDLEMSSANSHGSGTILASLAGPQSATQPQALEPCEEESRIERGHWHTEEVVPPSGTV